MPIPAPPISLLLAGGSWPPPTCVDSHVVLVVGGTGEAPAAARLWTHVGPLARVRPDVNLADVGRGKGAATAHEGALEGTLTCMDRAMWVRPATMQPPGDPFTGLSPYAVLPPCCSPVCVRMCFCRSPEVLKALLHKSSGHLYGFSPVCVLTWLFSPYPIQDRDHN